MYRRGTIDARGHWSASGAKIVPNVEIFVTQTHVSCDRVVNFGVRSLLYRTIILEPYSYAPFPVSVSGPLQLGKLLHGC